MSAKKSAPMSDKEKKAKKAAYDKARRAKAKKGIAPRPIDVLEAPVKKAAVKKAPEAKKEAPKVEKKPAAIITKTFDHPVRLFWNRRFEEKNSSCAKPEIELNFEEIESNKSGKTYRVRRGKRNFFTNTAELEKSGVKNL